jgi:ABC-2 type transport system permease protein
MSPVFAIARRELRAYFATPLAPVFTIIFLLLSGASTFYLADFFDAGQADLQRFFQLHPWLYLLLVPAVSMPLWAEERKSGTLELLLTQPVATWHAVFGKFLAAWGFIAFALALTFPLWITVNWLGSPDNGVILAGYLGSLLLAGAYLALGGCMSAITRSQVVAFVLTVMMLVLGLIVGYPIAIDYLRGLLPAPAVEALTGYSFLTHFIAIQRGVLDLRDVAYFVLSIAAWLCATVLVLEIRKAD